MSVARMMLHHAHAFVEVFTCSNSCSHEAAPACDRSTEHNTPRPSTERERGRDAEAETDTERQLRQPAQGDLGHLPSSLRARSGGRHVGIGEGGGGGQRLHGSCEGWVSAATSPRFTNRTRSSASVAATREKETAKREPGICSRRSALAVTVVWVRCYAGLKKQLIHIAEWGHRRTSHYGSSSVQLRGDTS